MGLDKAKVLKITPAQAINATGTWTFDLVAGITNHQLLVVGTEIMECDTGGTGVATGNIAFAVGATGTSATSAVNFLVSAITNSSTLVTAWTGASGRILKVEWKVTGQAGTAGQMHCSATLTGAWTATSLIGTNGTPAAKGTMAVDANYLYFAKDNNDYGDQNWFIVTGTLLT